MAWSREWQRKPVTHNHRQLCPNKIPQDYGVTGLSRVLWQDGRA